MLRTIVIVQDFANVNGGNAKVALSEAVALKNKGYQVVVFSAVGPIDISLVKAGVSVICLGICDTLHEKNKLKGAVNGIWNKKAASEFDILLSSLSPQNTIVHFHGWIKALTSSLFMITAKYGFKIVITLHDFFTICPNGGLFDYPANDVCHIRPMSVACKLRNCDSRSRLQKYWRVVRQLFMNYAIRKNHNIYLISISNITDRLVVPMLSPIVQRTFRLNNPVELNNDNSVDVTKNKMYTLISRVSPEKGVDMFCNAMRHLGLKGQVLGDGPLLGDYINKYPEVRFRGWCSDEIKVKYIKRTKCLVLTSRWYETFGLVVAEMKSYGIPSIVPNDCAASEQIEDGVSGLIFESRNQKSLEDTIMRMERENISAMHNSCLASDNSQYTMETHISRLVECYNTILN